MRLHLATALVALFVFAVTEAAVSGDIMIDTFEAQPEARWRFFTDGVMGGVSSGQVAFVREDGRTHARMTGNVSTANRGGFIQMRRSLSNGAPETAEGVRLIVRGNAQRYFVHLRTRGTRLPWQFYQSGFEVTGTWAEVRLPFEDFEPSGALLRAVPGPGDIRSIAIAAYGRDHDAEVEVREVGFY